MYATTTASVTLQVADGTEMSAFVARPQGTQPVVGLMVFQEAYGVNAHIRDVTDRFARQGYVAIAPELYHRTASGFEGAYDQAPIAMGHMKEMTREGLEADIRASYAWFEEDSGVRAIAAVGYCMGGRVSYLANATVKLAAAVSYYGGGISPAPLPWGGSTPGLLDRAGDLGAPMLMFWGGLDKHITGEHRAMIADALTAADVNHVQVVFSHADHGFFCDQRPSYRAEAARQSWALTLEFLRTHTKTG